ncbi:Outer membrane cobalamin receptor protein, SusC/RagA family [Bacteroidales bacterium Barb6XT]|nr:Outer membrane cobalamin receptor protein, SusC/RagA family [Bacteroidales bacterium Barb6XT]
MAKLLQLVCKQTFSRQGMYVWLFVFLSSFTGFAQSKAGIAVEGRVLDESSYEPLGGVNVFLTNEKTGGISDADGRFTVYTQSFPATLSFSYLGYKTLELVIYEYTEPVSVYIREDVSLLNEVVVIGYGTQKRKELTGAIASVPASILSQATSSFDNALGGAIPGVNVTQSSGQPGATSTIRIRGGNSITGGNEPLYVIDGFISYNDNNSSRTSKAGLSIPTVDAGLNLLSTINPADIESIEVLKDASATAIYGTRGANGVIIITTKKGTKGTGKVHYQSSFGWQQINKKIDLLTGSEWASLYNDIFASEGKAPNFSDSQIQQFGKGSDWQSAALRTAAVQNHQLSVSGGDEKTRYAISGNYLSQDGILLNTGFDRYTFRFNFDRDVFKHLKVGLNAIGSHSEQDGITSLNSDDNRVNTWVSILRMPPVVPIHAADGGYNHIDPYNNAEEVGGVSPNPVADLVNSISRSNVNRVLGNFFAEYEILPQLKAKLNAGADLINTKQNYFAPSNTSAGLKTNGYGSVGSKVVNSWQAEFTLNYEKRWNNLHQLSALAGYTVQKTSEEMAVAIASNFANDKTAFHSLQSASTSAIPYSGSNTSALASYIGRVSYSYLNRYNATATFRADGSSRFASSHKWGYFPSIGFSWNANEEDFLKEYRNLSGLKLRASVGTVGNQEIGDYQYESRIVPENYSFNGTIVTGYYAENRSNENLKWEKTTQYNVGVDAGFWKDQLSVTLDGYYKNTSDLLLNIPVQSTTGYTSVLKNIGSVSNKGIEIGLSAKIVQTKHLNWTSSLNWSKNVNEITDLGGTLSSFLPTLPGAGALSTVYPLIVKEGEPLGTFYGYVFDGVVQTGEESKVPTPSWVTGGTVRPGDAKYVDLDGDGYITTTGDKAILGSTQPDFTYGFNNSLSYKGADLSFFLQGSYGNELYNAFRNKSELTTVTYNTLAVVADRWTPSNPSNEVPRAFNASNFYMDSRYIEDASYLKLKNVTVGYSFPLRLKTNSGSKLRLYFSAQNLLTLTNYSGYDPESSRNGGSEQSSLFQGVDYGAYPSSKSFSFGVEITL